MDSASIKAYQKARKLYVDETAKLHGPPKSRFTFKSQLQGQGQRDTRRNGVIMDDSEQPELEGFARATQILKEKARRNAKMTNDKPIFKMTFF